MQKVGFIKVICRHLEIAVGLQLTDYLAKLIIIVATF